MKASLSLQCGLSSRRASNQTAVRQAGFTLVEVMVGAVILVVVFLSTLAALQTGFKMIEAARDTTMADQILQSEIEDIRLYNWSNLSALDTAKTALPLPASIAGRFSAFRTITNERLNAEAIPQPTLKRILITVEWTNSNGSVRSRKYETMFVKNGINDYFVTSRI